MLQEYKGLDGDLGVWIPYASVLSDQYGMFVYHGSSISSRHSLPKKKPNDSALPSLASG
jgi:hypothetical protein